MTLCGGLTTHYSCKSLSLQPIKKVLSGLICEAEISLDPSSYQKTSKQICALLDQKLRNAGEVLSSDQIKYLRCKIKPMVTELLQNAKLVPPVSNETDGINPYHQELTFLRLD